MGLTDIGSEAFDLGKQIAGEPCHTPVPPGGGWGGGRQAHIPALQGANVSLCYSQTRS